MEAVAEKMANGKRIENESCMHTGENSPVERTEEQLVNDANVWQQACHKLQMQKQAQRMTALSKQLA
jgi:hypothetical protein